MNIQFAIAYPILLITCVFVYSLFMELSKMELTSLHVCLFNYLFIGCET